MLFENRRPDRNLRLFIENPRPLHLGDTLRQNGLLVGNVLFSQVTTTYFEVLHSFDHVIRVLTSDFDLGEDERDMAMAYLAWSFAPVYFHTTKCIKAEVRKDAFYSSSIFVVKIIYFVTKIL